jgi:hypothetical protein
VSLAQTLSTYLTLNLLIVVGFAGVRSISFIAGFLKQPMSSRSELTLHYALLSAIVAITLTHPLLPKAKLFEPPAKVWSAQSIRTFSKDYTSPDKGGYLAVPIKEGVSIFEADRVSMTLLAILIVTSAAGVFRLGRDWHGLRQIRRRSFLLRKIGGVRIYLCDDLLVPFSYWRPGAAHVVMPSALLETPHAYRIALAHEIQHHRQSDTKWVYAIWFLRIVCAPNPFIYLWSRSLSEIQEFACDETLVDLKHVDSQAYASCLIQVAETTLEQRFVPACATGLMFLTERNLLKRRIEKMISSSQNKLKRSIGISIGICLIALMAGAAFASQGIVQDRRVSMTEAQAMALRAQGETGFPVVVNDLVLKQLNRYIGTPEGRDFMRKSLQRMENYRSVIEPKLREYDAPVELMAIPVVESGYQNLEESNQPGWGAGIWMFIPSTARKYGLRVNSQVDERLNAELLTDAAMRLLKGDKLLFNDWLLSILAYNMGGQEVEKAIQQTGSRDAWTLIRKGYENDKDYLARVMAAILIMKNPESVR